MERMACSLGMLLLEWRFENNQKNKTKHTEAKPAKKKGKKEFKFKNAENVECSADLNVFFLPAHPPLAPLNTTAGYSYRSPGLQKQ